MWCSRVLWSVQHRGVCAGIRVSKECVRFDGGRGVHVAVLIVLRRCTITHNGN